MTCESGMLPHNFFLSIMLILIGARIFAEIARRTGIPPVIGELSAGIVLGPSLLGWIMPTEAIRLLAEIGIILLLFDVGLDTDLKRLSKSGWQSVGVALVGFFTPLLLGFAISYYLFDFPVIVALFIGGTITATSIGITVRVLSDLKKRQSVEGEIVLGAAVLDDILGVILLAVLFELSKGAEIDFTNTFKIGLFICAFFIIAPIVAKLVSLMIRYYDERAGRPEILITAIFSLVLFFAWLAHQIGAPEIMGGFAAGLALSRRFFLPFGIALRQSDKFDAKLEQQMHPILYLFTPIFFVMVGLSMNLSAIDWHSGWVWLFGLSIFAVALLGKMAAALIVPALPPLKRLIVGFSMVPRGEVGLIFAEIGRVGGILENETYAALILVIILTTLLPPFAIKWLYGLSSGRG